MKRKIILSSQVDDYSLKVNITNNGKIYLEITDRHCPEIILKIFSEISSNIAEIEFEVDDDLLIIYSFDSRAIKEIVAVVSKQFIEEITNHYLKELKGWWEQRGINNLPNKKGQLPYRFIINCCDNAPYNITLYIGYGPNYDHKNFLERNLPEYEKGRDAITTLFTEKVETQNTIQRSVMRYILDSIRSGLSSVASAQKPKEEKEEGEEE
jgi:hypothetical protein